MLPKSSPYLFAFATFFLMLAVQAEDFSDLRDQVTLNGESGITRAATTLRISVETESHSVGIPRFFASLISSKWIGSDSEEDEVTVHPEPDHWIIRWKNRPATGAMIELKFDTYPYLAEETRPATPLGDGRINLHAFQARTIGKMLRFEPQSHKNTVGYWIDADDHATWRLMIMKPGEFNVGILQGCGAGQGGSEVVLSMERNGQPVDQLAFTAEETGHFQNFHWRTLGVVKVTEAGEYELTLRAKRIAKKAVMDVRQIQLVPRPQ